MSRTRHLDPPNGRVREIETVVVGGGQAGLAAGYHLERRGLPFVILDANPRIGDAWRRFPSDFDRTFTTSPR